MASAAALPDSLATNDPDLGQQLLDAVEAEDSLRAYTRLMWNILEPGRPMVWSWHMDCIGEHLQAVTDGELNRVIFNVPPGFTKSLQTNVFWPSWEWGPRNKPFLRYLSFAYAQNLTIRDNLRCRRLIQSPLYQRLWGQRFSLVSDQNAKVRYDTDQSGFRMASSIGGTGTGERADRLILDDPNNVQHANSVRIQEATLLFVAEVLPTRVNDIQTSAIVLIQQRTGVNDVTGHMLKSELGYEYVCYDDQTEVLTEVGWRRFDDLIPGCRVMGVDPKTLKGQWERPFHYIAKPYQGPMYAWRSMTADLVVTPDHRMLYGDSNDGPTDWRIRPAADLPQDFYLPQALGSWDGAEEPVTLGRRTWGPLVYGAFMGWFLSEGNASASGCYTIITQKLGATSDDIARLLDICPFDWKRYDWPDQVGRFQIGSRALARDLQPLGKSHTKRIPRALIDMSRNVLERFLAAYIAGDGHLGGIYGDRPSITTASSGMADDLQEVAVKLGWAASIEHKAEGHYSVHLRRSKGPDRPRKSWSKLGAGHRETIDYDGEVFCVSVPSTALVVRRHGRVAISGNCLPMEFEPDRACYTPLRRKGIKPERVRLVKLEEETVPRWMPAKQKPEGLVTTEGPVRTLTRQDRRTKEGQLLDPKRFPRDAVEERLKKPLMSHGGHAAVAGQLQQRPQPREGSMFKRENFRFCEAHEVPTRVLVNACRGYDLAASEGSTSPYTAGVKVGQDSLEDVLYVLDVERVRLEPGPVMLWHQGVCKADGPGVHHDFPQDPAAGGKSTKVFMGGKLAGYKIFFGVERGTKPERAIPFASQVEIGNVILVRGPWNDAFIAEAVTFPGGDFKDQIDAAARAYARALKRSKTAPPSEGPKVIR